MEFSSNNNKEEDTTTGERKSRSVFALIVPRVGPCLFVAVISDPPLPFKVLNSSLLRFFEHSREGHDVRTEGEKVLDLDGLSFGGCGSCTLGEKEPVTLRSFVEKKELQAFLSC